MRSTLILILFVLSSYAYSFEGVVVYSQADYVNGKKIPPITTKISVYFKDNLIVRVRTEYDKAKFTRESDDVFISHEKERVIGIDKTAQKYTESSIDKKAPIDHDTIKLGKGDTIQKYETTIYTFADTATAKSINIHYADILKVTPTPYLFKNLASQIWGIHPVTGAIAMKFDMLLENNLRRVIEVTSVESKTLKPADYVPSLSGLEKN